MEKFKGKNVVITGAAEGVGRTIAYEFCSEGANVILVDRIFPEQTLAICTETGVLVKSIICDITDESQIISMAKEVGEIFSGKIDILINNAGFNGKANLIKNIELSNWEYTLKVNLTGTMLVCREMIPYLEANGGGNILNMASNVGKRGLPFRADYVSSKWAVRGLTQTLAFELAESNIRVNAVCPGPIKGDRVEQLLSMHSEAEGIPYDEMLKSWEDVPMKRMIEPKEVASVIMFLCGKESSAMTGQSLNITGGMLMD